MYLRKNRVKCGNTRRTYLSIAHNVWWSGDGKRKAQSRPVVVASFGAEDNVDIEIARELVTVVERCAPKFPARRGELRAATLRVAQEVRRVEPFLKMLASRKLGLGQILPPHPEERAEILETLVRDRFSDPEGTHREEDVLNRIRSRLPLAG